MVGHQNHAINNINSFFIGKRLGSLATIFLYYVENLFNIFLRFIYL